MVWGKNLILILLSEGNRVELYDYKKTLMIIFVIISEENAAELYGNVAAVVDNQILITFLTGKTKIKGFTFPKVDI